MKLFYSDIDLFAFFSYGEGKDGFAFFDTLDGELTLLVSCCGNCLLIGLHSNFVAIEMCCDLKGRFFSFIYCKLCHGRSTRGVKGGKLDYL